MRTTITLDPDVNAMVRALMRERRLTFKQAVNEAIRAGGKAREPFHTRTFNLGEPAFPLDRALGLAGEPRTRSFCASLRCGSRSAGDASATRERERPALRSQPGLAPPPGRAALARHGPSGGATVGFAWVVVLAFVRLSTHPAVFPKPLSGADALGLVRDWLAQPSAVVVEPAARHAEVLGQLLAATGTAGNLVNDAHLAALALEHGGEIVSFDADFSRFPGVRWRLPAPTP